MRIAQNNSGLWCQRKTTQFRLENEKSEPQMWDKHAWSRAWSFLAFAVRVGFLFLALPMRLEKC